MWKITYDCTEKKFVDIFGPGCSKNTSGLIYPFRLLDDDGEVYYEGLSTDCDSDRAFDPLDDYGTPNAGCTEIQYKRGGAWVTL